MNATNSFGNLELDQGVDHLGRVFGYDHLRHNFVVWGFDSDGQVCVVKVERDSEAESHGSIADTRREADAAAERENSLPNSRLARAIMLGNDLIA